MAQTGEREKRSMSAPKLSIIITSQDWATPHLDEIDATALHGLYIADHPSFPVTESWTWLAFAAARTRRIALGTHVTGAPFYHPTRLAKQVASVDVLSGGRAVLGIGTAYEVQDFLPYGFPMPSFRDRVDYLDETLEILERLFSGRIDGFRGRFHTYEGEAEFAPRPVRGRVPVWIGLNKAGLALQVAARRADAINTWQLSPDQVAGIAGPLAEAVERAGRPAGAVAVTCDLVMARGADSKGAEALAHRIRDMARGWGRKDSVTDWGVGGVLHGDGDAMIEQLGRFAEVGCTEVTVSCSGIEDVRWLDENVARRLP
jgi:alkanesulfonate monooxygenase SsuD/methylene tetrahydromethanopterin reductase-like flavin-dependent oxidoreductase (luciferase family)